MAEDKPRLDLAKLLAGKKPSVTAGPEPTKSAGKANPGAVQLSGKLFPAKNQETPKNPAEKPGAQGVGGHRGLGAVGQAGGVARGPGANSVAGALSAPPKAAQPDKALNAAAPSNHKLEKQVSRQGAKQDRLNVVQKEERQYPYLSFGIDELYLYMAQMVNIIRANLWRARPEYPGFVLALEIIGSVRQANYLAWDGEKLSSPLDTPPSEPILVATCDANDVIDHIRGKITCRQMEAGPYVQVRGDMHLARLLHLAHLHANLSDEERELLEEREGARLAHRARARAQSKTPLEWLEKSVGLPMETAVRFIDESIFFRVTASSEPKQELLFHIENRKLTTLVGKPGEVLLPGAAEVTVSPLALRALWDLECEWHFLFSSGQVRASGDLELLSRLHWVNREIVRRVQILNRTGKLLGPDADYWLDMRAEKPSSLPPA